VCRESGPLVSTPGRTALYGAAVRLRQLVGAAFIGSGVLHFTQTRWYEAIMPPYIPRHREMVLISGVAEAAGGAGVLVPAARPYARWWLLALLIAVFPANVHMALNPRDYRKIPEPLLWARLPLQGVFGWLVWRATE
jgi:uncharacterized membrane protein